MLLTSQREYCERIASPLAEDDLQGWCDKEDTHKVQVREEVWENVNVLGARNSAVQVVENL